VAAALDVAALKATLQVEAALQAAVSMHEVGGGVEVAATAATARRSRLRLLETAGGGVEAAALAATARARGGGCSRRQAAASRGWCSRRPRARARAPELAGLEAVVHEAAARGPACVMQGLWPFGNLM
jgi:hypothetical protein